MRDRIYDHIPYTRTRRRKEMGRFAAAQSCRGVDVDRELLSAWLSAEACHQFWKLISIGLVVYVLLSWIL